MTVYVITSGEYSDYAILGVFTEQGAADKYVEMFNEARHYEEACVEPYEADTIQTNGFWFSAKKDPVNRITFFVSESCEAQAVRKLTDAFLGTSCLTTVFFAPSRAKALKIAADRFTQFEAQEEGI